MDPQSESETQSNEINMDDFESNLDQSAMDMSEEIAEQDDT